MYTIYYIYENRMDTVKCTTKELIPYYVKTFEERGAKIVCIKDNCGEPVEY